MGSSSWRSQLKSCQELALLRAEWTDREQGAGNSLVAQLAMEETVEGRVRAVGRFRSLEEELQRGGSRKKKSLQNPDA